MQTKIDNYDSATALIVEDAYNHGQQRPIVLRIDWEEEEITARVVYERNSTPGAVWHGLQQEYTLPGIVDALELADYVRTAIQPLAESAIKFYSTEWDGSNRVGRWQRDVFGESQADAILEEIDQACQDAPELSGDAPGLWDVGEWAQPTSAELNADTTDEQIEILARDIEISASADNVVLGGPDLRDWLTGKRDDMREDLKL